jgi:hypothetical protein
MTDSTSKPLSSLFTKIGGAVVLGWIASFILFFGYTYLKGYLEGAGFESPIINPSIYDLVYYFLVSIADAIAGLLKINSNGGLLKLIVTTAVSVGVVFTALVLLYKYAAKLKIKDADSKEDSNNLFERLLEKSGSSFKQYLIFLSASTITVTAAYATVIIGLITLLALPWVIAVSGSVVGNAHGLKQFNKRVCVKAGWSERKEEKIPGCTELVLKSGKALFGKRLYKNKDVTFFITNDGAYEINSKKEIQYFKPFLYRPEKSEASADSEKG